MKYLKTYKIFESIDINLNDELDNYRIYDYTLNEDGSIDCDQDVNLTYRNLNVIPFNFDKVNGYFHSNNNSLISLKNCPKYINRFFNCSSNKLESLEYGPEYVGKDYICHHNQLTTLKGCVEEVYGSFNCRDNLLTSLEFCPMQVEGIFNCSDNRLIELDRSPFVRDWLYCKGMFKSQPEFTGSCKELYWK